MDRRLIWTLLAVAVLAGVVSIGSGGASAWAPIRRGRPEPMALVVVLAAAVIVGVAGAWALAFLLHRGGSGSRSTDGRFQSVSPRRVLPGAVAAIAVLGLLGLSRLSLGLAPPAAGRSQVVVRGQPIFYGDIRTGPVKAQGTEDLARRPWALSPVPAAAALLIFLMGGGALLWWWRGGRSASGAEEGVEGIDTEAVRATVLRSIEAMLSDPDPNTAVIGAYARLLEGLAASGVPRRDYEGPVEHLRRVLTQLRVRPGPVHRLVSLFEVARFSTERLTVKHRDEAIEALHQVASDLGHEAALTATPGPGS